MMYVFVVLFQCCYLLFVWTRAKAHCRTSSSPASTSGTLLVKGMSHVTIITIITITITIMIIMIIIMIISLLLLAPHSPPCPMASHHSSGAQPCISPTPGKHRETK